MPTFEVRFHTTFHNPGNHDQTANGEPGQIVAIQTGPAFWWTAGQINQWAINGDPTDPSVNAPPGLDQLPEMKQVQHNRLRLRFRRFLHPNFSRLYHINARFEGEPGIPITQGQLDNALAASNPSAGQLAIRAADAACEAQEDQIQRHIDKIAAHGGGDTLWQYNALKVDTVIRVDATPAQVAKFKGTYLDGTINVFKEAAAVARNYWKIDIDNVLTPQQLADAQNPDVLVHVDRVSAPISAGAATIPVVRDEVNNPPGPGLGVDP